MVVRIAKAAVAMSLCAMWATGRRCDKEQTSLMIPRCLDRPALVPPVTLIGHVSCFVVAPPPLGATPQLTPAAGLGPPAPGFVPEPLVVPGGPTPVATGPPL